MALTAQPPWLATFEIPPAFLSALSPVPQVNLEETGRVRRKAKTGRAAAHTFSLRV